LTYFVFENRADHLLRWLAFLRRFG